MSSLKQSIFWVAFYLVMIVILAQFDSEATPIIDFAKYFYFLAVVAVPATVFFPSISKVGVVIPMAIWGCIYLVLLQILDRNASSPAGSVAIIFLEFILVQVGVWLGYQVASGIIHAESLMDALAFSAFPNKIHDIELESQRIKVELTRCRRYNRPLCLAILEARFIEGARSRESFKSVQFDLMNRFATARIGQIIEDKIRQTDLLLKDSHGRFIVLCPETDIQNLSLMAERINRTVLEKTNQQLSWGFASFPEDALIFEDLIRTARERLSRSVVETQRQVEALN